MDVLFVCTGNTCRSPMAEAIMRRLVEERGLALSVDSAGLRAESVIAPKTVRALERRGIAVHERTAVQLTGEMVERASLVLCMTEEQRRILAEAMPGNAERIFAWCDFVARAAAGSVPTPSRRIGQAADRGWAYDVPDPWGQDDAAYEATAATIEALAVATLRVLATPSVKPDHGHDGHRREYRPGMRSDGPAAPPEPEDDDAQAVMDTGIRDQRLVVSGWGASHADTGTPGPHVHLSTNDRQNPVLRTSQIPELVDALHKVGERIDRMWEQDGATWFTGDEPDDNDPGVIRQRRIDHLVLLQNLRTHFSEIAEILLGSQDMHDASTAIAPLLGIDEMEVTYRLNSINLFAMTRTPSEAIAKELADLRQQP